MTGIILGVFILAVLLTGVVLWLRGVPVKPSGSWPVMTVEEARARNDAGPIILTGSEPTTPTRQRRTLRRVPPNPVIRTAIIALLLDAGYDPAEVVRQLAGQPDYLRRRVRAVARQRQEVERAAWERDLSQVIGDNATIQRIIAVGEAQPRPVDDRRPGAPVARVVEAL
jgi:hypothetical protein